MSGNVSITNGSQDPGAEVWPRHGANLQQDFNEEFTQHVLQDTVRQQWQLGTMGCVGAGIGAVVGVAATPLVLPATLLAGGLGGVYGFWRARARGLSELTESSGEMAGLTTSQRPTLRRLKYLVQWGHKQLRHSTGSPAEWRALVLDEVVRAFSPWVQELYLARSAAGMRKESSHWNTAILHLMPLYYMLQLPAASGLVAEAAGVAAAQHDANALDSTCVERCCVCFPTILEVISTIDQLTSAKQQEVARVSLQGLHPGSLLSRAERRCCFSKIVNVINELKQRPGLEKALCSPVLPQQHALHSLGVAVLRPPRRGWGSSENPSGDDDSDGEFFSCSEDEGPARAFERQSSGKSTGSQRAKAQVSPASATCPVTGSRGLACPGMVHAPASECVAAHLDAKSKMEAVWEKLRGSTASPASYPEAMAMMRDVQNRDYAVLLDLEDDFYPQGMEKVVCSTGGVVAPVRIDWRDGVEKHFTGMFHAAEYGIVRCSSIIEPQAPSRWSPYPALVPMVAAKFFRDGGASANIIFAHKKSGHKDPNFLSHAVSNHFTENIAAPFRSMLKIFYKYSDFPTFAGCAQFATVKQDGTQEPNPRAPYAIVLSAPGALRKRKIPPTPHLKEQFSGLAAGDVLYEVYAVPEPLGTSRASSVTGQKGQKKPLWRIGDMKLLAPFASSGLGDRKLFFQHFLFEKDLELRPDWRSKADKMVGAPFYEELIDKGEVWSADGA
mmetsp:Transcript_16046/g.35919  ORF Transcript_16046/g.35919 Transcript_16046/m.35919 type:complete len:725 (-) Transcript_16046:102-2276(-)